MFGDELMMQVQWLNHRWLNAVVLAIMIALQVVGKR